MYDRKREIQEARNAGIRALNSLQRARKSLDSARNWGLLDILGGGFLTTMMKHGKLDDANASIEEARRDLIAFERELQDVSLPLGNVGTLLTFMDFWKGDLLADILVQHRINEMRAQVDRAIHQVEFVMSRLSA